MARCLLGLGANLGDPIAQIGEAIARLDRLANTRVVRVAPLYETTPIGPPGQPDYVNSVVEIETKLEPRDLLEAVKTIERELGRTKNVRWGARMIDLDILIYGDLQLASAALTIPHTELAKRRFVLQPLADLDGDLVVPRLNKSVRDLLDALEDDPASVRRIS